MSRSYGSKEEMVKRMTEIQGELAVLASKGTLNGTQRTEAEEARYQELSEEYPALDMTLKAMSGQGS